MAPINPNNTERWWLVYEVNGFTHRMMCRTGDGATAAEVSAAFDGLLVIMAPMLNAVHPSGLEFALRGSNIRNTAPFTGLGVYGTGTAISNDGRAAEYSFVGRSLGGKRTRLFLFGGKTSAEGDYRIDAGSSAAVAAATDYLNSIAGKFLSIDALHPTWKTYINTGLNDFWVKQARHG